MTSLKKIVLAAAMVAGLFVAPVAHRAEAAAPPVSKDGVAVNMRHVANLRYADGLKQPAGTDLEFVSVGGRDYAVAGTYYGGLFLIDITDPTTPSITTRYDCAIAQGDPQVFQRDGRTYVAYTSDDGYSPQVDSLCYRQAGVAKGLRYGTFIIDITDVKAPEAVSFIPVGGGSHNSTIHPSGRWMYNSDANLGVELGQVEVFDLADLAKPKLVHTLDLVTGMDSHDITFSSDGKRAYVAALTHTLILDTTNPAQPAVIGRIIDPTINIHHQSDPVTITDPVFGERSYLIVTDELAGAAGNVVCPGGGLHVYDITGPLEALPVKVGFFVIPEIRAALGDSITCTSHVLRIHEEEKLMTIAWYAGGVRVIDLSSLVGVSLGLDPALTGSLGMGMKEVGSMRFPDSDTWSAKTNEIAEDGSFYLFGNDMVRGFDVYRYTPAPKAPTLADPSTLGTWLRPGQLQLADRATAYRPFCLIPR